MCKVKRAEVVWYPVRIQTSLLFVIHLFGSDRKQVIREHGMEVIRTILPPLDERINSRLSNAHLPQSLGKQVELLNRAFLFQIINSASVHSINFHKLNRPQKLQNGLFRLGEG